jgi:acyl-CoA dehydrogenase
LKTTAVRDGDHYIVNGSKTYITGGMRANYVSTAVRTGGEGATGVSMLLIPTDAEGFSRTPLDKKMGWWASDTATLHFDNVRVPVSNLIGQENQGFKVIMTNFNSERMGMAASMEALVVFVWKKPLPGPPNVKPSVSVWRTTRLFATRLL